MKTTFNLNGTLAISGGLPAGLGAGFFFLQNIPLYFVGSLLSGPFNGLIISSLVGKEKVVGKSEKIRN